MEFTVHSWEIHAYIPHIFDVYVNARVLTIIALAVLVLRANKVVSDRYRAMQASKRSKTQPEPISEQSDRLVW